MRDYFLKYRLYLFAVLLFILVPVLIYYATNWNSKKIINGLSFEGNRFVPQQIFQNLVPDSLYMREKGRIKLKDIRMIIEKYPFVKNANVMFGNDDTCKVILNIREPIAQLVDKNGKLHLVDSEGVILPYLFFENFSHLPLLRNCDKQVENNSLGNSFCFELLNVINKNFAIISGLLSELINTEGNSIEMNLKKNGIKVIYGDSSNKTTKLKKLTAYLKLFLQSKNEKNLQYIDLRWSGQLVVY